MMLNWAVPSKSEFEGAVNNILQRPDYRHLNSSLRDLIDRLKEDLSQWILKMLNKTFSNLPSAPSISDNLSRLFLVIGILIVFAAIIYIFVKGSRTFDRSARVKEILGEKIDNRTTPLSLRNRASQFEREGDLRRAVRYDFIALLLLMHEKGILYLDETKTNYEIYNYLRKNEFLRLPEFKYLTDVFNSVWYGHKANYDNTQTKWKDNLNIIWNEVIQGED